VPGSGVRETLAAVIARRRLPARKENGMGQPVVHFEVIGKDGPALQGYYAELFGWEIDANNPMKYGTVAREGNLNEDGAGIGGGVAGGPEGYDGHVTFYVQVPDVEASLAKAESLGGTRTMGPDDVMPGLTIGMFQDPEGHTIGVMSGGAQAQA
jgi:predicted enzyme related to lactoylglutathione lyase